MTSESRVIAPEDVDRELNRMMFSGNTTPFVSTFETTKLYDNAMQAHVCNELITYLNTITTRPEQAFTLDDAMKGALVGAVKFAVQAYYQQNKRNFTKEHRDKILSEMSAIMDTQLDSMKLQQVFAH